MIQRRRNGLRLLLLTLAASALALFVAMLVELWVYRVSSSVNSLRQIALAISAFERAHGHYPPVYVADDEGKPLLSWRVLILPFLDEQPLYDKFDLGQPWDGPHNIKLVSQMPKVYRHLSGGRDDETRIRAIVGPSTMWPRSRRRTRAELPGRSIGVLVETDEATVWAKPDELSLDDVLAMAAEARPLRVGFHDGHTGEMPKNRILALKLFAVDN